MKWSRQRTVFLMAMAFGVVLSGGAESVSLRQDISIVKGWNALYLAVTPEESADEIFGAWPVEMVGVYNPSSFLVTKQFSGSGSNEGVIFSSFNMWRRDKDLPSPVTALQANYIYVFYATNSLSTAVFGVPNAPRNTRPLAIRVSRRLDNVHGHNYGDIIKGQNRTDGVAFA